MKPLLLALTGLVAVAACGQGTGVDSPVAPGSPAAIVNGAPTGAAFGNVGALLFDFGNSGTLDGDDQFCSGTLIAPTVLLTAGHCLTGWPAGTTLHVSFAPDLYAPGLPTIAAAGFLVAPGYGQPSDPHDLGVVFLPAGSTAGITPATLPPAGYLDDRAARGGLRGQDFINVGYGNGATRTGPPAFPYDGKRRMSTSPFQSLDQLYLGLHMTTAATGTGGDCYGDSGGPKFIAGNLSMIVAIVSWGDSPCRALSKNYRLDTASARSFLGAF